MSSPTIEYRPRPVVIGTLGAVLVTTAVVLAWVGSVLDPADRSAMDGFARLLFTVVPIRGFAWTFAAVFSGLGVWVWTSALRARPTLTLADTGLVLSSGRALAWSDVRSIGVSPEQHLVIRLEGLQAASGPAAPSRWRAWRRDGTRDDVVISAFALGADPVAVSEAIQARREGAQPPG